MHHAKRKPKLGLDEATQKAYLTQASDGKPKRSQRERAKESKVSRKGGESKKSGCFNKHFRPVFRQDEAISI